MHSFNRKTEGFAFQRVKVVSIFNSLSGDVALKWSTVS